MSASDVLGEATGRAAEVLQRMASLKTSPSGDKLSDRDKIKVLTAETSPSSSVSTAGSDTASVNCTPRTFYGERKDLDSLPATPPETGASTPQETPREAEQAPMGVFRRFTPRGLSAVWTVISNGAKKNEDLTPQYPRVVHKEEVGSVATKGPTTPAEQLPMYSAEVFRRRRIVFSAEAQAATPRAQAATPRAGNFSFPTPRDSAEGAPTATPRSFTLPTPRDPAEGEHVEI